jgi:hypothetical protein
MPSKESVMAATTVEPPTSVVLRRPTGWPVDWSAVWVGALSAVVVSLIIALIGVAIGAHAIAATRIVRWKEFGFGSLIFSIFGAFLAFTVGGWVAGRISGYRWSEPAILHGAIAWLVGVSLIVTLGTVGTTAFGPWYRGIGGFRVSAVPAAVPAPPEDPDAARAARNAALGGVTAILLGLVGAAIGGWMASGEPMTLTHHRSRERRAA